MLNELLETVVNEFRLGREGAGSDALVKFLDVFLVGLSNQDFSVSPEMNDLFQQVVEAQQRGDYLRVADLLEYELRELLWSSPAAFNA